MKIGTSMIAALALVFLTAWTDRLAAEVTDAQKAEFFIKVDSAYVNQDMAAAQALYEPQGMSEKAVQGASAEWQAQWNSVKKLGLTPDHATFLPLNSKAVASSLHDVQQGITRDGRTLRPNLPVIGFAKLSSSSDSGHLAMVLPIGQEADGSLRFAAFVPAQP
jgi:hypothetical protein